MKYETPELTADACDQCYSEHQWQEPAALTKTVRLWRQYPGTKTTKSK